MKLENKPPLDTVTVKQSPCDIDSDGLEQFDMEKSSPSSFPLGELKPRVIKRDHHRISKVEMRRIMGMPIYEPKPGALGTIDGKTFIYDPEEDTKTQELKHGLAESMTGQEQRDGKFLQKGDDRVAAWSDMEDWDTSSEVSICSLNSVDRHLLAIKEHESYVYRGQRTEHASMKVGDRRGRKNYVYDPEEDGKVKGSEGKRIRWTKISGQ